MNIQLLEETHPYLAAFLMKLAKCYYKNKYTYGGPLGVCAIRQGVFQRIGQPMKVADKIGRNSPCPCGSGKKYKRCCGK